MRYLHKKQFLNSKNLHTYKFFYNNFLSDLCASIASSLVLIYVHCVSVIGPVNSIIIKIVFLFFQVSSHAISE
jgi:hypothetical protein